MSAKDKTKSLEKVDAVKQENKQEEIPAVEVKLSGEETGGRQALILKRLGKIQEQLDESGLDRYRTELEEMYSQEETYFIKQKIKRMLSLPLDDLDIDSKRIFINEHWNDICHEIGKSKVIDSKTREKITLSQISKLNPLNLGDISDSDIERYFNFYRKVDPYSYATYESSRYEFFYDDKDIVDTYRMSKTEYTSMYPFYYSRMAKGYCALYDSGKGNVIKLFKLNDDVEQRVADRKLREGDMQIRDLEDIIIEVEGALREGDTSYVTKYIYFRKGLPQSTRDELDKKLRLSMPLDLDKKFFHEDEFNILLEKNRQEIEISSEPGGLEDLNISLKNLLEKRYEANARENQGFKVNNINLLRNIASGYNHVLDGAYYWLEDYLRDRRFFPDDLVEEFEKRFPINFKQYATSEFPYFNKSFLEDIKKTKVPIRESFQWLGKEILSRIGKINESRPELKEIPLDEVLEREGFSRESMSTKEYGTLLETYTALMELETRRNIETEFGIKLKDFSVRKQIQFVNFLSAKSEKEVIRVKQFFNQTENKKNQVSAFLSLESNEEMGEVILGIGENLRSQPEVADRLFAEYAKMVDGSEKTADEIVKMYDEIFFEKQIDRNEIIQVILREASELFENASKDLKRAGEEEKKDIILKIIEKLAKKRKSQESELIKLKNIADVLNSQNKEINDDYTEFINEKEKDEIRKKMEAEGKSEEDIEDYLDYIDFDQHMEFNPAIYDTGEALEEMYKKEDQHGRFDSGRIFTIIEDMEKYYENNPSEQVAGIIERFQKYLKYQQSFEKKLEQLVYGRESASLPDNYLEKLAVDIDTNGPELPESQKQAYLPVGISSRPPQEGETHQKPIDALLWLLWLNNQGRKTELLVADTIQRHNYEVLPLDQRPNDPRMAAIRNGERDREWYLAVKKVLGLENIEMPENVFLSQYEERVEKNPKVQEWLKVISELEKESPAIARALENLLEPTIRKRVLDGLSTDEERDRARQSVDMYGKEELAFILGIDGQKIGHKKEIRYDMLARIIPIYRELSERSRDIPELTQDVENIKNRDQALIELSLQLAYFNDFADVYLLKEEISITQKDLEKLKKRGGSQEQRSNMSIKAESLRGALQSAQEKLEEGKRIEYIEETVKSLGISRDPKKMALKWRQAGQRISQEDWFKKLNLPEFFYPIGVTSLSFDVGEKEAMNFREPYSTYKGERAQDLPIEANQMIASTDFLAAAKVMVLGEKNQRIYFEKVLRPLVVNYYIAANKSKEEAKKRLQEDFENVTTISEVIELIQRKIIWPLEMELQSVKA
jgi:hypothetical protein